MTHFPFLQKYVELQKDIMFDELIELDVATICYCENDPSPFWNNALVNTNIDTQQKEKIASILRSKERLPAFYFENSTNLTPLIHTLEEAGYQQEAEDSFMFHSGEGIDESRFGEMKKVENQEDLEVFLATFDACYQKDDPQNPYGELGEYLIATRKAWEKHHPTHRMEYFLAYKGNEPVAVATLTNHNGLGYISNVGSLSSVRGQGYGKLATMYCVVQSKENENAQHFLITEEGTNPNEFYEAIGFVTQFRAKLMVSNNKSPSVEHYTYA